MTERGSRKVRVGRVVSDKMEKTVVVSVERMMAHPLYGRRVKRTKRYMAHDENSRSQLGDLVRIIEDRPLSRKKHWRVLEVLDHSAASALRSEEARGQDVEAEVTGEVK